MKNPNNSDNAENELVKQAFKIITMGKELIQLEKFNEGIDCYNKALEVLKKISGYENEIQKTEKLLEDAYIKYTQTIPQSEQTREEIEQIRLKKENTEDFEKQKKEIEEKSELAYDYLGIGFGLVQSNKFDEAMENYNNAIDLFKKINWHSEIPKVNQLIKELEEKKNQFLIIQKEKAKIEKKKKELIGKEQEIISKQIEFQQKSEDIQKAKLESFREQKYKEKDLSNQAYNLLGKASKLEEENQFDEALENYNLVIELFKEIGWQSEIPKVNQFIKELGEKKKRFLLTLERKKKIEQKRKKVVEKEREITSNHIEFQQKSEDIQKAKLEALREQKQKEKGLSNQAYNLLGKASELIQSNEFEKAYENYNRAIELFNAINWQSEIPKVNQLIKELEEKKQKFSAQQQKLLKREEIGKELLTKEQEFLLKQQELKKKSEDLQKAKIEKLQQKKQKEEDLSTEAYNLLGEASELEEYNQFEEGLESYQLAIEIFQEIGWHSEIPKIKEFIKKLKSKQKKFIKALQKEKERELQSQAQIEKLKEIELIKEETLQRELNQKEKKLKSLQKHKKEQKRVEKEIQDKVTHAEKLEREYEKALKKGKFDQESPYNEIISIYKDIIGILKELGWTDQIKPYKETITHYEQKLVRDTKLRELELQKEEAAKIPIPAIIEDKTKTQAATKRRMELEQKKRKQERIEKEIQDKVTHAEKLEREYEKALKKGKFDQESPYNEIIKIYEDIIKVLEEVRWIDQTKPYKETIKHYEEKLTHDIKLRELELQKEEAAKIPIPTIIEDKIKTQAATKRRIEVEQRKREQERIENEIQDRINYAESLEREYDFALRKKDFSLESPFIEIIEVYEEIIRVLKESGWTEQIKPYGETIKHYEQKLARDIKLKELEQKKLEKIEIKPSFPLESLKDSVAADLKMLKYEEKKREEEQIQTEVYEKINVAENIAREYEWNLKYKDFSKPCPYENVIKIYREAKKSLKSVGWNKQAEALTATIIFYKNKLEKDGKFRELERIRELKKEKEKIDLLKIVEDQKVKKEKELDLKRRKLYETEVRGKQVEALREKGFQLMDRAKLNLRNKKFDESIELYEESKRIFEEIDYKEGVDLMVNTIQSIKNEKELFTQRLKKIKEIEEAKLTEEKEMEQRYKGILEEEKLKRKEKLLELADKKKEEKKKVEKAFNLITKATNLVLKEKFDKAYEYYMEARQIFINLNWKQEVSKIDQDHLYFLNKKRKEFQKRAERLKKISIEKKEMAKFISEAEKVQAELEKSSATRLRERYLEKEKEKLRLKSKEEESYQALDESNKLIDGKRYNSAVRILRKVYSEFVKSGWEKEANKIKLKIDRISKQSIIPIILEEEIKKEEFNSQINKAFQLLDEAERASHRSKNMRVVSLLVGVKEIFEEIQWNNALKSVKQQIEIYKRKVKEKRTKREAEKISEVEKEKVDPDTAFNYMDKCKMAERRKNFLKAIQFAERAFEIFKKLGSDWEREVSRVEQYIKQLQTKEQDRRAMIESAKEEKIKEAEEVKIKEQEIKQRLEERRKRREELRKRLQERKDNGNK